VISKIHLSVLVWAIAGLWVLSLALDGTQVSTGLFKPCSTVVTVLGLLLLAFDKWLWRFRLLHPWFVDRPYIRGTWKGQLTSQWVDPKTNQPLGPIEVYLVVRQTFSSIHLRLITRQSSSESLANNIPKEPDGVYTIASIYRNTPKIPNRVISEIHHGGVILQVLGDPVHALEGHYWTDRGTLGELRFVEKSETLYFDFDSACQGQFETVVRTDSTLVSDKTSK
jgi:hypothetical protein